MTSKISFSKMVKNDLVRRLYVAALLWLGFFSVMPLNSLLGIGVEQSRLREKLVSLTEYTEQISTIVGAGNGGIMFGVICSAVLIGITGFSYLHSPQKTDLYHALPIKRKKLFFVQYVSGILLFGIPYFFNLLLMLVVCIVRSAAGTAVLASIAAGAITNILYFFLLYHVTIIAMLLTGKILVALLGTGVFWTYSVFTSLLVVAYKGVGFDTFYETETNVFDNICTAFSPVALYSNMCTNLVAKPLTAFAVMGESLSWIGITILETILLLLLAVYLYKRRSSESAGRSIAFPRIKPIIKIFVIALVSAGGGIFFIGISQEESLPWLLFGIVFAGLITHCAVEVIYAYDFKQILKNKGTFFVPLGVTILLIFSVWFDWYGYDTNLPAQDSIETMALSIPGINMSIEYPYEDMDSQYVVYSDQLDYAIEHGQMEDIRAAYTIAELGVENEKQGLWKGAKDQDSEEVLVAYRLKSGKITIRRYQLTREQLDGEMKALYETDGFEKGEFTILNVNSEEADLSQVTISDAYHVEEKLNISVDKARELLNAYRDDLIKSTYEERIGDHAIGTIAFRDSNYEPIAATYTIYDGFEQTREILESYGYQLQAIPRAEDVTSVTVYNYSEYYDDSDSSELGTYTDREQIAEILLALSPEENGNTAVDSNYSVTLSLQYDTDNGMMYLEKEMGFKTGEIPEFIAGKE